MKKQKSNSSAKIVVYQVLPRLFGNDNCERVYNGDIITNGCGKFADINKKALDKFRELGATHVWYTGVICHASCTDYSGCGVRPDHPAIVKGKAGSPYAIKDYYDVDPDLAVRPENRMKEFEELVERTHKAGMKVIIDFVPNHVARQYHSTHQPEGTAGLGDGDDPTKAFSASNNFYYIPQSELHGQFDMRGTADEPYKEFPAKATGNDRFDAYPNVNDWYETIKLNYGVDYSDGSRHFSPVPDTWDKMLQILLFWAGKGIDGFRCDMAEMVPVEFWEWATPQVKSAHEGIIFIAEVYNPAKYHDYIFRGGFDYLYDKVGLYDTLRNITCGHESATAITRCWQSLGGIEKYMLNFLENHDEQRIASDYFAANPFKAIPALIVSACLNTNPMMIYFGQEFGELGMDSEGFSGRDGRTTIFDYWSVESIRCWRNEGHYDGKLLTKEQKMLYDIYKRVLNICNEEKAVALGTTFDLMYANIDGWRFNEHRQYAFLRKYEDELLLIAVNFDSLPADVAINIPPHAFDYLQVQPLESSAAIDLLTGEEMTLSLLPQKATELKIGSHSGRIMKFKL
jgi:glycosidase